MSSNKKILGERIQPGEYNENTSEHLHRYALALSFCSNKTVLDIACGDGYGSNIMAGKARSVSGVDIDEETILRAKQKYKKHNLEYKVGDATRIPYPDNSFDVVISFETLEHHDRHDEMMSEIERVLVPGGICMISTPDKLVYSDKKNYQNPFHVKELYKDEFVKLIKTKFANIVILKQQFFSGSLILPDGGTDNNLSFYNGTFDDIQSNIDFNAEYLIAIASNSDVSFKSASMFIDSNFAQNKILQYKKSSLRYKLGYFILNPIKYLRGKIE